MQTVVTHSGSFDPDDVLAVATVQLHLGVDEVEVVRSRDSAIIDKADWVVDVGGKYEPDNLRFDHHQNGVPKRDNKVPYSSFGLVWREIGEKICGSKEVALQIEERLVQPIDAADNNIMVCKPGYSNLASFQFFDVINTFKPVWGSDEDFDTGFMRATAFARRLLKRMIARGEGEIKLLAMIEKNYLASEDKELLIFDSPIQRDILSGYQQVKMFVSPVFGGNSSNWMVNAVPKDSHSVENRALFPKEWVGLSNSELEAISKIDGAVFCHKERFLFVAKTKEAALQAAAQATITK